MKKLMKRQGKISRFICRSPDNPPNYFEKRSQCMAETTSRIKKLKCLIKPEATKKKLQSYWSGSTKVDQYLLPKLMEDPSKEKLYKPLRKINSQTNQLMHRAEAGKNKSSMNLKLHKINKKILEKGMNIDDKFLLEIQKEVDQIEGDTIK